ncbi:MAG: alpha/beta hydrolase fold domain-containing protein, partial [Actinomycetota bacterium]
MTGQRPATANTTPTSWLLVGECFEERSPRQPNAGCGWYTRSRNTEQKRTIHQVSGIGTSAGGGLAIALMAALRDEGGVAPPCAVLLSPGVDMTLEH